MNTRIDEFAVVYDVYRNVNKPTLVGSVFRGYNNLHFAKEYAKQIHLAFKNLNAHEPRVFVVKGPTSTTGNKYEVVSASCGYQILFEAS